MSTTDWLHQECISFIKKMNLNSSFFFFLIFLSINTIAAPPLSIVISADSYKSTPDQTSELVGNVKVSREAEVITCQRAFVNNKTGDVVAEGNVTMITPKDYIRAEKMSYNFLTKKGVFTNGFIQTGQETIEGEEIIKIGESQFYATHASYTSCINCPPGWKLSGSKIDATVGGYAYVTSPLFRVYNVPIFWLPWVAIPIKNERQSGLLAPSFISSGSGGKGYGDSYFWAINNSQDATFSAMYYEYRGTRASTEYRFVADKNSSGIFKANFIGDKFYPTQKSYQELDSRYVTSGSSRPSVSSINRHSIKFNQHMELPEGFSNNFKLSSVRDTRFLYDFPDELSGSGDPALENRVNFSKNTENTHASLDIDIYQNLLVVDPLGQNEWAVHRAPEIKFSLLPQKIVSNGQFGFDFNYTNFVNSTKSFYDSSNSTDFNFSTSRYLSGQRFIIHPFLSFPFNAWNWVDIVPQLEYEETFYQFGYSSKPSTSRRYARASINAKTRLSGIYEGSSEKVKFKHEIIPELTYSVVPYFYQENHPFFGTSTQIIQTSFSSNQPITEYDLLQFDYRDRIADRSLITYGFTNKLIRKKINEGSHPSYKEILLHRLTQSYDIYSLTQGGARPFSEVRSLLELKQDYYFAYSDLSYYPYENITVSTTTVGIKNDSSDSLSLSYSQGFQLSPNYSAPNSAPFVGLASQAISLTTLLYTKIFDLSGTASYDMIQRKINSYSLSSLFKAPGKCWGISATYTQIYDGDKNFYLSIPIYFGEGRSFDATKPGS